MRSEFDITLHLSMFILQIEIVATTRNANFCFTIANWLQHSIKVGWKSDTVAVEY